ncbi:hypothetical protein Bca52824_023629 [Brassica carinata]|uniref:Uncharacterized protein n=1 Tax=Brassica carinata TaxID=52824 RepID=A0A8X8AVV9_BRACI|nr:hypothetical protein Bca52824_023629 [Brassica carinata]
MSVEMLLIDENVSASLKICFRQGVVATDNSRSTVSGAEGVSQIPLTFRHPSLVTGNAPQETDIGSYRSQLFTATHYGTQYGSVYGATSLTSSQLLSTQGIGSSGYVPTLPELPKHASGSYVFLEQHIWQFGERLSVYLGRELQSETTARYADSQQP